MNRKIVLLILVSAVIFNCSSNSQTQNPYQSPEGDCQWCGARDAPPLFDLSHSSIISSPDEPGERLKISGYVNQADGKSPAKGILVYVYHTNQEGIYPKRGDEKDNARRHGYLRGWMITDEDGYYEFETIKPEPYPSISEPAHIHYTVSGVDFYEYWIKSLLFEGDPLIEKDEYKEDSRSGGSNRIISLKKEEGKLSGNRNIVLNPELMQGF